MSIKLDVRGEVCPKPIVEAQKALRNLAPGEILEIVGDDPGMVEDFRLFCQAWGHGLIRIHKTKEDITIILRKGTPPDLPPG